MVFGQTYPLNILGRLWGGMWSPRGPGGSIFGRYSAKLGPETPLDRQGSSYSAGRTENQPRRPVLKPFRDDARVVLDSRLHAKVWQVRPKKSNKIFHPQILAGTGPKPLSADIWDSPVAILDQKHRRDENTLSWQRSHSCPSLLTMRRKRSGPQVHPNVVPCRR